MLLKGIVPANAVVLKHHTDDNMYALGTYFYQLKAAGTYSYGLKYSNIDEENDYFTKKCF